MSLTIGSGGSFAINGGSLVLNSRCAGGGTPAASIVLDLKDTALNINT